MVTSSGSDLFSAIDADDLEAVVTALDNGAPVDARGRLGRTACFMAAALSRIQILSLLIKNGADFELPDECGNTPLMAAVVRLDNNGEAFRLLLRAGADPMRPNSAGATPALMVTPLPAELGGCFPTDPNPLGLPTLETLESTPNGTGLSVGRRAYMYISGEPLSIEGSEGSYRRALYENLEYRTFDGQPLTDALQAHIRCYLVALGNDPLEEYPQKVRQRPTRRERLAERGRRKRDAGGVVRARDSDVAGTSTATPPPHPGLIPGSEDRS